MNESIKRGIYVDLDVILDTRLATIFLYNKELLSNGLPKNYANRTSDSFEGMNREIFKDQYKKRDITTLKESLATRCMEMIRDMVIDITNQAVVMPMHTGAKIFVNTFPYDLSEADCGVIVAALVAATGELADIKLVSMNNTQITPRFIKQNFSFMFKYEYGEWLDEQAENLKRLPCPEVGLMVPAIYFVREPTDAEMVNFRRENINPFKELEKLSSIVIGLKFQDVGLFSISI